MIECYKTATAGSIERIEAPESGCWVNAIAPTPEERAWLEEELGVLPEFVRSALDDEETSRIDYDEDVNQTFVIVDYPVAPGEEGAPDARQYDTMPLSMVFIPEKSLFVTLGLYDNPITRDMAAGRVRGVDTRFRTRFLLQILLRISQLYLVYLRRIDRLSSATEEKLHASVRNEELIQMLSDNLPDVPHVFISSVTGRGIAELKDILWKELNSESNKLQAIMSQERIVHKDKDVNALQQELQAMGEDEELEFVDEDEVEDLEDFEYEEDWDEDEPEK